MTHEVSGVIARGKGADVEVVDGPGARSRAG